MYRQQFPDDPGDHQHPDVIYSSHIHYHRSETFWERITRSWVQFIFGILLLAGSFGLTIYNEGRAVQTSSSLNEGLKLVNSLENIEVPFGVNDDKLVHLMGSVKTSKVLYDKDYGVAISAVRMKRIVEMFQWVEHESKREIREEDSVRTETTYHYTEEWKTELISSDDFYSRAGHHNPKTIPIESINYEANEVQVGAFYLTSGLFNKLKTYKTIKLTGMYASTEAVIFKDYFYHGNDPAFAQIGDVRVSFQYTGFAGKNDGHYGEAQIVSIIAKQNENSLSEYHTLAGDSIHLLYEGQYSAEKMFGNEMMTNSFLTWAIRFAGWLVMFIGFTCLSTIITVLADRIPFIRELVMVGVHTLNLTLSISLSILTIAFGWLVYRPWLGISLIVLSILPYIINIRRSRSRRPPFPSSSTLPSTRNYED